MSAFGAGEERALIRWEWVEAIEVDRDSVVVRGAEETIVMPSGSFGLGAGDLAEELERARGIQNRSDVIGRLGEGADTGDGDG